MKEFKKFIINNKYYVTIFIISLITLIIGTIAFNFWIAFLTIFIINTILFISEGSKIKLPKKLIKSKNKSITKTTSKVTKNKSIKGNTKKKKIIKVLLIIGFSFIILSLIATLIFLVVVIKNAPEFNPDELYRKEASIIYEEKTGKIIGKLGDELREIISYDEMPEVLIDAIIATEDARFFQHNGFDLPRFVVASIGQAMGKPNAGGASTLTMQLSKNNYTDPNEVKGLSGIIRKFTDIYISIFKIEKKYTKYEILEFYLNSEYLGSSAYGVEQASQVYFGKSAKDMNLSEAALIVGLFNAPDLLDPNKNPEGAENRRKVVLSLMERHGYITKEERIIAEKMTVDKIVIEQENKYGAYQGFINTVVEEIIEKTDNNPYIVPMEIYATIDTSMQEHFDKIYNGEAFDWENENVNAGMAVIDVKTGAITAVGTGREKRKLGYNYATMIERHIGSTSKPLYDYAPGIEYNNWSSYFPFTDEPHNYTSGVAISNWDNKFQGLMTLREALKTSRNVPALKAFQSVDNKKIAEFTKSIGLSPETQGNIVHEAHSLGGYTGESPLSLAAAYATFANGGYYIEPYSFTKLIYRDNGEVFENKPKKERVMSESTAYIVSNILIDAAKWGLYGNYNVNGVTYAAKTGTSNFPQDIIKKYGLSASAINDFWIASFNPDYSFAQWYGYKDLSQELADLGHYNRFGSSIYRQLFQVAAKGVFKQHKAFPKADDVIQVAIEKDTSPAMLPSEFTPSNMIITELFKKGTEPTEISPRFAQLDNPTNLDIKQDGSIAKITWDPITTPKAIDQEYLKNYFNNIFNSNNFRNSYLNNRNSYNKQNIGEIGYNVYLKNGDNLELLGFTKNNYYNYQIATNSNITIVIKSAYSIFKNNMSSGIETTFVVTKAPTITSTLAIEPVLNINIGGTYTEAVQPIIVYEDLENVSTLATVTTVIRDKDNNIVTNIDTSKENRYTITYTAIYKDYSKNHILTVIIE